MALANRPRKGKYSAMLDFRVSRTFLPHLCMFIGIFCIGFSAIFVRMASVPGVVSGFFRVFVAWCVLLPLWVIRGAEFPNKRTLVLSALSGVFFGLDLAFWNTSVLLTNAAVATVLAYLAPVWVGLVAAIWFKDRLKKYYWPGTILALFGMLVILGLKNIIGLRLGLGNILAIISSFFYAGYLLVTQVVRRRSGTLIFTTFSVFSTMIILFLICLIRGEKLTGFSYQTWAALLALGLISHLIGWYSINYALGHINASVASVTLLGQPVVTALASLVILSEPLNASQLFGGLLILPGIYLVNRS